MITTNTNEKELPTVSKPEESCEMTDLSQLLVPSALLNKTIGEIIKEPNTEISAKNGSVVIRQIASDSVFTATLNKFSNGGGEIKATAHPCQNEKKSNRPIIEEMIKRGKSQKDIAHELGMSQSYVSKLLKDK